MVCSAYAVDKESLVLGITEFVIRIRQNHALEHATMHILTRSVPSLRLVGRSDWTGFTLYGEVGTQQVLCAVTEGLARLKEGQSWLAVHPRCGTNLAVTAFLMSSGAALTALAPIRPRMAKAMAIVATMIGARQLSSTFSQAVQRSVTTIPDVEDAHIRLVRRENHGSLTTHRVLVRHDKQADSYVLHPPR